MAERLTDEDFKLMCDLLKKFGEVELDQWVAWRTETRWGTVYITISRAAEPGASDDAYDPF